MKFIKNNICKLLVIPSIFLLYFNTYIINIFTGDFSFNDIYIIYRERIFYILPTVQFSNIYFITMFILILLISFILFSINIRSSFICFIFYLYTASILNFLTYGLAISYMEQILNYDLHDDVQGMVAVLYSLLFMIIYLIVISTFIDYQRNKREK